MKNIQIQSSKPKRSVQSLIQDSMIDNQQAVINFQILQMKKVYNQTYKSFNIKTQALQSQLNKYKQKCRKLQDANVGLAQRCMEHQNKGNQYNQMKLYCQKMKRKVLYIQGKYQKLMENRTIVQQLDMKNKKVQQIEPTYEEWALNPNTSLSNGNLKIDKNQVYKEISDLIAIKIKNFTKQLRLHAMTKQLQTKIQTFLQELIYITPISAADGIKFNGVKQKEVGKIAVKDQQTVLISQQKAWKDISKTIQNPKQNNQNILTAQKKRQNLFNQQQSKNINLRGRSPLANYNNEYREGMTSQYRPSPKKTKIFINS